MVCLFQVQGAPEGCCVALEGPQRRQQARTWACRPCGAPPPAGPARGSWPVALEGRTKMAFMLRPWSLSGMSQGLNKYIRKLDPGARLGLPRVVGAVDMEEEEVLLPLQPLVLP